MSSVTHTATRRSSQLQRGRPTRSIHTTLGVIGVGALLLGACGSGSDDDDASTAGATATASSAASVETMPPATDPATTDPATTDTEAPTTEPLIATVSLTEAVIAEGTFADIPGTRFDGPAAPDGRTPFTKQSEFVGGLAGVTTAVGSFVIGETVEVLVTNEFTGELVGVGSGTFRFGGAVSIDIREGTAAGESEITGGTGVFADVTGTLATSLTDMGSKATYRLELSPVDPATTDQAAEFDAAAAIVEEVAASYTSQDFEPISGLLGDSGTWVAIGGEVYDRTTVTPFLEGGDFSTFVDMTRTGESVQGPQGVAFEVVETFTDGDEIVFWLAVEHDESEALVVRQLAVEPPW